MSSQAETIVYTVHTMSADVNMRIGLYSQGDGKARVLLELIVDVPPKTVGEAVRLIKDRICK